MTFVVAGAASTIVAVMPAEAAVVDNPVTSITVTPPNPRLADPVRTDVVWCVPDSTTAGDTFQIALPPELTQLPRGFGLRDPDGLLVATALIVGDPAVVTFTFTDYVDTHTNVCGTAFFESRLDGSLVPGNTYALRYVVNGGTTFEPIITIREGTGTTGPDSAKKGAFFDDPNDQCRTVAEACLGWHIESQLGPFQSITVSDDGMVGASFECDQLSVRLWSVDANGNLLRAFQPAAAGTTVETTCTPGGLEVVATNIPADRLLRVLIRATPLELNASGGVTFANSATVTHVSLDATVDEDNIASQRRSAQVGGDAVGVQPPATTTTTLPPTTTTALPPTTAAATPTTTTILVSALPPVPPAISRTAQLPATGSNGTILVAGLFMLLTGASLIVATRRRDLRPH